MLQKVLDDRDTRCAGNCECPKSQDGYPVLYILQLIFSIQITQVLMQFMDFQPIIISSMDFTDYILSDITGMKKCYVCAF